VEGGLYCAGSIQWARISSGTRDITPATAKVAEKDDKAWAVWHFDEKGALGANSTTTVPANATPGGFGIRSQVNRDFVQ
jgi:hypothetical protein